MTTTIDEAGLTVLVERFYGKVRQDDLLRPLFNRAVDDWPHHFRTLSRFWSSVMFTTGRYKGNPVAAHVRHGREITPVMFERWLSLWAETTAEMFSAEDARLLQEKAARIAESLKLAIGFHLGEPTVTGPRARPAPYRSTPIFDQDSLPAGLRRDHRTKAGTWGVIRVLEGALTLHFTDPPRVLPLEAGQSATAAPDETHWVEITGPMRMQVDFHDTEPPV